MRNSLVVSYHGRCAADGTVVVMVGVVMVSFFGLDCEKGGSPFTNEQMNQYNDNKGTTVVPGLIDFFCWDDMDVMYRLLSIQTMRLCEVCFLC